MVYSYWWSALGFLLIFISLYDFYITTLTVAGSGPLSKRVARFTWRVFIRIHHWRGTQGVLSAAGPSIILILIFIWFSLCWLGWFLVFCGTETAVVSANTLFPATLIERAYYAGYTLITIGYGDFKTPYSFEQLSSVIAGFNGFFLISLSITYSVPVVSAAVSKRKLALQISAIGLTTAQIVEHGKGSGDFTFLSKQLQEMTSSIADITEQYLAYPVLHYFHNYYRPTVFTLNMVRLDEAITLVTQAFPTLSGDVKMQFRASQYVMDSFLDTLEHSYIKRGDVMPPPPDCHGIYALHDATYSGEELMARIQQQGRRKRLLAFVKDGGWSWNDVHGKDDSSKAKEKSAQ